MPTWLLIAALATIGVTALLAGVLYRINKPAPDRARDGSDGGGVYFADGGAASARTRDDVDSGGDGGGDGGGGGGGGDGGG
jgi:hypothetical protein